jgi:septin 7
MCLHASQTKTHQDTPGYGDDLDILKHVKMVAGYIDAMNRRWLALESAHERTMDLSEADDPRVDACLFCLPPHRVRNVDLR